MGRPRKTPQPDAPIDFRALTQQQLADAVGKSARSIRLWIKEAPPEYPFPKILGATDMDTRYSLPVVIKWLTDDAVRSALSRIDASPENQAAANLRDKVAAATLKEIDIATAQGKLVDAEDVERTWTGALARFKSSLVNGKSTFADNVLALPKLDFISISEAYIDLINDALNELADMNVIDSDADEGQGS